MVLNEYDEYGEVFVDNESSEWMKYIPSMQQMTGAQAFLLVTSIFLCIGLTVYSCILHRRIRANRFVWAPQGRGPGMGRMQSGIISGRSRSGHKFDMRGGLLA